MDYFQEANPTMQMTYVVGNTACMYLSIRAMTGTTMIAMFGPGKALRGPDGSMHETVDGMLEEFEKAGISFQGSLYSFVFCLLVFAWTEVSRNTACALSLTALALGMAFTMLRRKTAAAAAAKTAKPVAGLSRRGAGVIFIGSLPFFRLKHILLA